MSAVFVGLLNYIFCTVVWHPQEILSTHQWSTNLFLVQAIGPQSSQLRVSAGSPLGPGLGLGLAWVKTQVGDQRQQPTIHLAFCSPICLKRRLSSLLFQEQLHLTIH